MKTSMEHSCSFVNHEMSNKRNKRADYMREVGSLPGRTKNQTIPLLVLIK